MKEVHTGESHDFRALLKLSKANIAHALFFVFRLLLKCVTWQPFHKIVMVASNMLLVDPSYDELTKLISTIIRVCVMVWRMPSNHVHDVPRMVGSTHRTSWNQDPLQHVL